MVYLVKIKAQQEGLGLDGPVVQPLLQGIVKATGVDRVDERERGSSAHRTLMPRTGLNPGQHRGLYAVDAKERHDLQLEKREWGAVTFQKSRRSVMKMVFHLLSWALIFPFLGC